MGKQSPAKILRSVKRLTYFLRKKTKIATDIYKPTVSLNHPTNKTSAVPQTESNNLCSNPVQSCDATKNEANSEVLTKQNFLEIMAKMDQEREERRAKMLQEMETDRKEQRRQLMELLKPP